MKHGIKRIRVIRLTLKEEMRPLFGKEIFPIRSSAENHLFRAGNRGNGRGAHIVDSVIEASENRRGARLEVVLQSEKKDWLVDVDIRLFRANGESFDEGAPVDRSAQVQGGTRTDLGTESSFLVLTRLRT